MKELYRYSINKAEKVEKRVENEDKTVTISYETEFKPVDVVVKKPSRRDREEMAMVYNAEFHKCLNAGIGTDAMIRRSFLDGGGGHIAKADLEVAHELYKKIEKAGLEIAQKKIDGDDTTELENQIQKDYIEAYNIESSHQGVMDRSAEALATRKSLIWAALNLTFIGDKYVFSGPTFEGQLNTYYEMCDEPEKYEFELKCFDYSYVFIERFLSGMAKEEEQFKEIENELNNFFVKENLPTNK